MNLEKFERFNSKYPSGNREVPVSWVRDIGKGRLFYTNFGHREDTYKNPVIMQHIFDGILFAIGYKKADTTPTTELPPIAPALAGEGLANKSVALVPGEQETAIEGNAGCLGYPALPSAKLMGKEEVE